MYVCVVANVKSRLRLRTSGGSSSSVLGLSKTRGGASAYGPGVSSSRTSGGSTMSRLGVSRTREKAAPAHRQCRMSDNVTGGDNWVSIEQRTRLEGVK